MSTVDLSAMSVADLQREIGRLQQELIRRVAGDPMEGVFVQLAAPHAAVPLVPSPTVTLQIGSDGSIRRAP